MHGMRLFLIYCMTEVAWNENKIKYLLFFNTRLHTFVCLYNINYKINIADLIQHNILI